MELRSSIAVAWAETAWALFALVLTIGPNLAAQAPPAAIKSDKGFTASMEFDGSVNSLGNVYELDSSVGYNFSSHFAMDFGIPFYFAQSPTSTTGGSSSSHQIGDPALGLHFKFPNRRLNYNTNLTGTFPIANTRQGFSTGRVTYDWSNHFDHAFSWLTPFLDAGVANSIMDTRLYHRPYTTLGYNAHFAAGVKKDVWKFFTAGASAYDVLPWGQQKMYSRVAVAGLVPANPSAGQHGRVFETSAVTTGNADVTRDNGYGATLEANPLPYVDLGVGYARSVHYALNTVSFSVGVNLGSIAKKSSH